MKKHLLFAVVLLLIAYSAMAHSVGTAFVVDPPAPREGDDIEVRLFGMWPTGAKPHGGSVDVDGRTITITLTGSFSGPTVVVPFGERFDLGRLEAGTYEIVVRAEGEATARHTFTVREAPFTILPGFSGVGEVLIRYVQLAECGAAPCNAVQFGGEPAVRIRNVAPGQYVVSPPARDAAGVVDVTVRETNGESRSFPNAFRYGGENEADYERVLFPLSLYARGANGSEWISELLIRNDGEVTVPVKPELTMPDSPVTPIATPLYPGELYMFQWEPEDNGVYFWVARGLERDLSYATHAIDVSRAAVDAGAEVPVVRAENTSSEIRLRAVPVRNGYRGKLRVYNFDPENGKEVTVRFTDRNGGVIVAKTLTLNGAEVCAASPCFASQPPFASLDFTNLSELDSHPWADITITAETRDTRLWAFASVTNNTTQHVTLYTPQHSTKTPR
jgi:hypothetical protein